MDQDTVLEARVPESEAPFAELAEDTVLATLFSTVAVPPPPPREHTKRGRGQNEYEARDRRGITRVGGCKESLNCKKGGPSV